MNRVDFMNQLENMLQNIPSTEREEALQYYNDYFDDAGAENEQSVIEALGTPAKVAENIKRDLYGSGYGDNVYQRTSLNDKAMIEYRERSAEKQESSGKMSTGMIVLIVLLCVLFSPIIMGLALSALGILIGAIISWFSLIFAFGLVAIVLLIMLIALLIVGVMCVPQSFLAGVVVIGIGFICGGLGILFLMLTVAMAGIATPAICRGIGWICRKLFGKKKTA